MNDQQRIEALGPAERIINTLTQYIDHVYHGRTGIVTTVNPTATNPIPAKWEPAAWKLEGEGEAKTKKVYRLSKVGKKTVRSPAGDLRDSDNAVLVNGRKVGEFRGAGLFPEVVAYVYSQIAEVWKLDNEFAAKWASWAMGQDYKDLKVVLAAFMLVQNRHGKPVKENGVILFRDEDYRAVGEAMVLSSGKEGFNAKMLLRVGDVLQLPVVADINRKLGFGVSARRAAMGRYNDTVAKWLAYREANPKLLETLVNKVNFRTTIMELARRVGYKPESPRFFDTLRWKQVQAKDGRRTISIGKAVKAAESWEGLSEADICTRIVTNKPGFKGILGMLPKEVGLTRAIMAASIEAGSLSDKDLIIYTPTLEELGLLEIPELKARWEAALKTADDRRAANIAKNVKDQGTQDKLNEAADKASQKAVEAEMKDMRVYFVVDKSGSMRSALDRAIACLAKFVQGFPLDKIHVSVFNSIGTELKIPHASAAGVMQAFRGHTAGGGTLYGAGVEVLAHHKPKDNEDALVIFIGDQEDNNTPFLVEALRKLRPSALGLLYIKGGVNHRIVEHAAAVLKVPCIPIDEKVFDDPYASVRVIRNLIASTPVGAFAGAMPATTRRSSLVETILKVPLLKRPTWADPVIEQIAA